MSAYFYSLEESVWQDAADWANDEYASIVFGKIANEENS